MHKPILVTLAIALAIVAATGCGSDSSPTKAEYIEQADAVCNKAEKQKQKKIETFLLENASASEKKGRSLKEQAQYATDFATQAVIPSLRIEADELNDLDTPSEEGAKADAITKEFDEMVARLEDNPAALSTKTDPFEEIADMARGYGFKTCLLNY